MQVLAVLLVLDAVFLVLHALHWGSQHEPSQVFSNPDLSLSAENGYAEWFGYGQTAVAVALLVAVFSRRRDVVFLGWAFALLVIVLDDGLALHERVGQDLAKTLGLPSLFGLRAVDLGEMLTWAALGAMVALVLWVTHRRSGAASQRTSVTLLAILAALVFFAIVMDMISVASSGPVSTAAGTIEDGGELLMLSVFAAVAWGLWRASPRR